MNNLKEMINLEECSYCGKADYPTCMVEIDRGKFYGKCKYCLSCIYECDECGCYVTPQDAIHINNDGTYCPNCR